MPQADAQTNTDQQEYRLSIPHHAICQNPELQPGSRVEQDHIDVWMNQTEFTKLMGPQANIIDFMQLRTEDSQGFGIRVQFVDVDAQESPRNWQTRVIQACRQAQGQPAAAYGEIMKMARTRENLEPRAAWFLICLFRETLHPSEMPDARILDLMAEAGITPDQVLQENAQAPETGRHPAQRAGGQPTWEGGNITNRLGVWYDDDMTQWTISGKEENRAGTGSEQDLTALARMILENIPDESGHPASLDRAGPLPRETQATLQQALRLAHESGNLSPEQQHRAGGLLLAAGLHLIRRALAQGADSPGPITGPSRLPFGLWLDDAVQ